VRCPVCQTPTIRTEKGGIATYTCPNSKCRDVNTIPVYRAEEYGGWEDAHKHIFDEETSKTIRR